ncbi:hypothetical protein M5K25_011381 [Dendrobium thyrsiflorum]|uniref:Uncharacterized protein n=1 Tax=Dendrobium thyrsiflorum TaxID=117978 RepID=A0ABD0V3C1_DENTH
MADPDVDHGFVYDDQGRTDILGSPFFDVHFGTDETVDDYLDRILCQLSLSIEEHISSGRWYVVNHSPTPPNLAPAPMTTIRGFCFLLVASLNASSFGYQQPHQGTRNFQLHRVAVTAVEEPVMKYKRLKTALKY